MYKKLTVLLLIAGFSAGLSAKHIAYYDNSCRTAAPDLINLVDGVAQEVGYVGDYELVEPTMQGLLQNPWSRMMYSTVNPLDQNNLILINQDWFSGLNRDEQRFLIARYLIKLQLGSRSWLMVLVPYIFGLISLLVLLGLLFLFNQTILRSKNLLVRVLLAIGICAGLEVLLLDKLSAKALKYATLKFNCDLNQLALVKLPNKPAAINALQYFDQTIKAGIKDGHSLYKEHENTFADLVCDLNS